MNRQSFLKQLNELEQTAFLEEWKLLSEQEREIVAAQIDAIDLEQWKRFKKSIGVPIIHPEPPFSPLKPIEKSAIPSTVIEAGQRALANGSVGCIVVAGGQGTRLGFNGPKGAFPLTPQSLFELLAEKAAIANRKYDRQLPLAMMTSPLNDAQTQAYFAAKGLLELIPEVSFFKQAMLPLLTEQGDLFLAPDASLAEGPDGNGSALFAFYASGLWQQWAESGVRAVQFIQIDNALAHPFDSALAGLHLTEHNEITVQCVKRHDPQEPVGILIQQKGHSYVLEYSEISSEEKLATDAQGNLKHPYANISRFCFSMEFIQNVATQWQNQLPLHIARKKAERLSLTSGERRVESVVSLKGENFILDVLPLAHHIQCIEYPREECFAPLKNLAGPDSPATVLEALKKASFLDQ